MSESSTAPVYVSEPTCSHWAQEVCLAQYVFNYLRILFPSMYLLKSKLHAVAPSFVEAGPF